MTSHPYLQHLIPDPTFGYLFPHRLTLAAFGVPNDYHLRKHYPRLIEGQHYLKIRGSDHVERLFYSLAGLLVLSDLVNTPQSQAFKQALIAHTQPKGAIVPSPPSSLYQPPVSPSHLYHPPLSTASHLYTEQIPPTFESEPFPVPEDYTVPPELPSSKRPLNPFPAPPPPPQPTLQETAALIFEAQRVATQQAQQTAQTLLEAQRLLTDQPPTEIQVNITLWKHLDSWLSRQDTWAMSLIVAAIVSLAGMGAYFFAQAAARQTPIPQTSSQTWR